MTPARPSSPGTRSAWLVWFALVLGCVAYFIGFRDGWLPREPLGFAGLVALALLVTATLLAWDLRLWIRHGGRHLLRAGRLLMLAGVLAAGLAGWLNWAFSLQGFMVLVEGEEVPLFHGMHLQEFEAGPLADPAEMGLVVQLAEVELVSRGEDGFVPDVKLLVTDEKGDTALHQLVAHGSAAHHSLRLHSGAFGFAPHLILAVDGEPFFDRVVPFTSRRDGPRGISFEGLFTVASHDLEIRGSVLLDSLNSAMRGHPALGMTVRQGREVVGGGSLNPGHVAQLNNGMTLTFAGLKKWAEIDISRRNYPGPILAGGGAVVLGVLLSLLGLGLKR